MKYFILGSFGHIGSHLVDFLNKVTNFNPKNYILSNFTLQKQALNLMKEFI